MPSSLNSTRQLPSAYYWKPTSLQLPMVNILWQNIIVIKCNRDSIGLKRNRRDMITLSTHKRNEDIVSFLTDVFLYCLAGKKKKEIKKKRSAMNYNKTWWENQIERWDCNTENWRISFLFENYGNCWVELLNH